MYSLDVYSSAIWGTEIHFRDHMSFVSYPSDVNDDELPGPSDMFEQIQYRKVIEQPSKFKPYTLRGWNFITDLYRILENVMVDAVFRGSDHTSTFSPAGAFLATSTSSSSEMLNKVLRTYQELPAHFEKTSADGLCARRKHPYESDFLAANITTTFQLIRYILFPVEEVTSDSNSIIVTELVAELTQISGHLPPPNAPPLADHHIRVEAFLRSVVAEELSVVSNQLAHSNLYTYLPPSFSEPALLC